jgi:hypothetical protein
MAFSLTIELLNMRYRKQQGRLADEPAPGT